MWYTERMRWVNELMEIFNLSVPEMAKHIFKETKSELGLLDPDQPTEQEIRERFVVSLRASKDGCLQPTTRE